MERAISHGLNGVQQDGPMALQTARRQAMLETAERRVARMAQAPTKFRDARTKSTNREVGKTVMTWITGSKQSGNSSRAQQV